jgi:putative Mn2+ efflux pump MntP
MQHMLLCSIDSFVAAIAIGFFAAGRTTRIRLAVMFAVCDCTASFAGAILRASGAWPGFRGLSLIPLIIPLAFAAVVLAYYLARRRSFLLWGLPVLLSVDNLASGWFDPSPAAATSLLLGGLLSGVFALAGFTLASYVEARLPQRLVFVSGLILVVLPFAPTF